MSVGRGAARVKLRKCVLVAIVRQVLGDLPGGARRANSGGVTGANVTYSAAIMPKVTFRGRVIPEVSDITLHSRPALRWQDDGTDYWMEFNLEITRSEITVDCIVDEYDPAVHFGAMHMRASDIAAATVNLIAFANGLGVTTIFDTFTDPAGETTQLLLRDRPLGGLATAVVTEEPNFTEVLNLVIQQPKLYNALRDLIHAIRVSSEIPASCGSAVEAVRALMVPEGFDRRKSWPLMQASLNLDAAYLKLITDHSVGPRHGDHQHVPGTMTREIATRSWTVMNRFLEYLKRGRTALPLNEFPLLKG